MSYRRAKEASQETAVLFQLCNGEILINGGNRDRGEVTDKRNAKGVKMKEEGIAMEKKHGNLGYWLRALDKWWYHSPGWEVREGCYGEGKKLKG